MKNFVAAKKALQEFLSSNSNGEYYVVGHSLQKKNAQEIERRGSKMVQVYITGVSPDRYVSSRNSETTVKCTAIIRMTVTASIEMDLATIEDPNSTPEQRALALADSYDAAAKADDEMDELFGHMFDLVLGADGEYHGSGPENPYQIADSWGDDFTKEEALKGGSLVVINGYFRVQFTTQEIPNGDIPVVGNIVFGTIDLQNGSGDELQIQTGE